MEDRKIGFRGMAKCYQELKDYKTAVRCFKKLLEVSWDTNDYETEIYSYEGLSQ
jgi:tetratricopeptide (TPR) repeat protein